MEWRYLVSLTVVSSSQVIHLGTVGLHRSRASVVCNPDSASWYPHCISRGSSPVVGALSSWSGSVDYCSLGYQSTVRDNVSFDSFSMLWPPVIGVFLLPEMSVAEGRRADTFDSRASCRFASSYYGGHEVILLF